MPITIRRAAEADRSYYAQAACVRTELGRAWVAEPKEKYRVGVLGEVEGSVLLEMGRQICFTCPVQWECATAALVADERAGVWADYIENLRRFRNRLRGEAWREAIEMAKSTGTPVQVLVSTTLDGIS